MSHQVRTPACSLLFYAECISELAAVSVVLVGFSLSPSSEKVENTSNFSSS